MKRWHTLLTSILAVVLLLPHSTALAQRPTPASSESGFAGGSASGYAGNQEAVLAALNAFWADTFTLAGLHYRAPRVHHVAQPIRSACNSLMYPEEQNAFYCTADETVYLFPAFMDVVEKEIGDYAPFTIIGHEWGHHVQFLTNAPYNDSKSFELQADCLSGAFMDYVESRQLLDAGDFLEAIIMSGATGDDASAPAMGLPVDSDDAHGTSEEHIKALVKGYGGGITRCGLSLDSVGGSTTSPVATETS